MISPSDGDGRRRPTGPATSTGRTQPTLLGSRYLLEHPIGQGASGRVWRGRRRRDGTPVAIKILREEYATDPEVIARFLRERTALQALDHPNLVKIDDLVVEGDTLAVVMELVEGQDLLRVFQRGVLDTRQILSLLAQVADGLAHIHAAGVLHRDVKPENILVAERDGKPFARLTDFGLAWVSDGQRLTHLSDMVGTPAYAAPELLAGHPYGAAVDVYALGVTAHELLTGRPPFTADNSLALMRAHLDTEPERPRGLPRDQWEVLSACLAKSPRERPTAEQLVTWWESIREGLDPSPVPAEVPRDEVQLSIDFGACNTSATLRWPDGRLEPLLFGGSPLLPSAVYAEADGTILTGNEALNAGRLLPQRFDPYPKLRIHDGTVWLGNREFSVVDLIAAVLHRVGQTAQRVSKIPLTQVTITHPANWHASELTLLDQAADAAGLPKPRMFPEPVAAASYLLGSARRAVPVGGFAMVCDFGAGNATASVVRRGADGGFDLVAAKEAADVGGVDIDTAILAFLGEIISTRNPEFWQRLSQPQITSDRRAAWQLWDDVRKAKEILSRETTTSLHLPLLDTSMSLHRTQLEDLAQPIIDRAVAATQSALAAAAIAYTDLAATFLIGGCSHMPLTGALLSETLGHSPATVERPEPVVAEGALHLTPQPKPTRTSGDRTHPGRITPATRPRRAMSTTGGWRPDGSHVPTRDRAGGRPGAAGIDISPRTVWTSWTGWKARLPRWQVSAAAIALLLVVVTSIGSTLRRSTASAGAESACGYKIAFLGETGSGAPASASALAGAKTAVDKYNVTHTGCTVELVEYNTAKLDNSNNSDSATFAGPQAEAINADRRVLGVVGPIDVSEADEALPELDSAGVPVITPTLPDTYLAESDWRVFHRTLGNHHDDVAAGIRQLTRVLKARKVFVVADQTLDPEVASRELADVQGLLGGAMVGSVSIADTGDASAQINKIKAAGADSVYYLGYWDAGGNFLKQLRAAKVNIPVMGNERIFRDAFLAAAGKTAAEGVHMTCPCAAPEKVPTGVATDIKAALKSHGPFAIEGFDAATIFLSGIAGGKRNRDAMLTWVHSYDRDGTGRHIKFTAKGDLDVAGVQVSSYHVAGGRFAFESVVAA